MSCQRTLSLIVALFWRAIALPCLLAATFWLSLPTSAQAGSIDIVKAELRLADDNYVLSATFNMDLGQRVEEALVRGIPLYFDLEFELTKPRWYYWRNEVIANRTIHYRLTYNPLTRQYRLGTGTLYRSYESLADALQSLGRLSALYVADKGAIKSNTDYEASISLALDQSQLPKPFQLDAFANRDWDISSKRYSWHPQLGDSK